MEELLMGKIKEWRTDQRGLSLIELLVVFVICAAVVAGTYRVFVAQSKAYTVQDQVVDVQQGTRSSMEFLLRDLRMAGFNDDNASSQIEVPTPLTPGDNSITVSYELDYTTLHTITYARNAGTSELTRQLTTTNQFGISVVQPVETLLENVGALNFTYGVDTNGDDFVDNWVQTAGIGTGKVVAVRVVLTAGPDQTKPDFVEVISPRTLVSTVAMRNMCKGK
jgi:type IV pilus assembly protein PilW